MIMAAVDFNGYYFANLAALQIFFSESEFTASNVDGKWKT